MFQGRFRGTVLDMKMRKIWLCQSGFCALSYLFLFCRVVGCTTITLVFRRWVQREFCCLSSIVKADGSVVYIWTCLFLGCHSTRKHERVNRYIQGDAEYVGVGQRSFCVSAHHLCKSKLDWHQVKFYAKNWYLKQEEDTLQKCIRRITLRASIEKRLHT